MNFGVMFTTNDDDKVLVENLGSPGLDILDEIRNSNPEISRLDVASIYINDNCPINGHELYLPISEDLARRSGLFAGRTQVSVTVPEVSFSKFVSLQINERYDHTIEQSAITICGLAVREEILSKYLTAVNVTYAYEANVILNSWESAGFSTEWSPKAS